jgi:secondary thiamine-phosphate synthase enzyme
MCRVYSNKIILETAGGFAVENITEQVLDAVHQSGISHGNVVVHYQHTTGAVILDEYEAGIIADLEEILDEIAPVSRVYHHHLRAVDRNGWAHIRSALLGSSVTIPIGDGEPLLGRYQQVFVLDMQVECEPRSIIIQVMGI